MEAKEPSWTLQLEKWGRSKKSTNLNMPIKKEVSRNKKLPKDKKNYREDRNTYSNVRSYMHGVTQKDTYESIREKSSMQKIK